uniref:Pol protein n=1 Tax=Steinernema glaseri TaxID=37863 RepID=A0A1I8AN35_9BILA
IDQIYLKKKLLWMSNHFGLSSLSKLRNAHSLEDPPIQDSSGSGGKKDQRKKKDIGKQDQKESLRTASGVSGKPAAGEVDY